MSMFGSCVGSCASTVRESGSDGGYSPPSDYYSPVKHRTAYRTPKIAYSSDEMTPPRDRLEHTEEPRQSHHITAEDMDAFNSHFQGAGGSRVYQPEPYGYGFQGIAPLDEPSSNSSPVPQPSFYGYSNAQQPLREDQQIEFLQQQFSQASTRRRRHKSSKGKGKATAESSSHYEGNNPTFDRSP